MHAVDTSPAMLDVLDTKIAERHWSRVRTGMSLPVERHAFDLVVCSSVCAFLDAYPSTVAELVARLRPAACSCNGTGNATASRTTA